MKHLSGILNDLFKTSKEPLNDSYRLWQLWEAWPQLFKDEVFKNTLPVKYSEGKLFIYVPFSSQLQDLIFIRERMKNKINFFFQTSSWVKDIRLTLDKKSIPSHKTSSQPKLR